MSAVRIRCLGAFASVVELYLTYGSRLAPKALSRAHVDHVLAFGVPPHNPMGTEVLQHTDTGGLAAAPPPTSLWCFNAGIWFQVHYKP